MTMRGGGLARPPNGSADQAYHIAMAALDNGREAEALPIVDAALKRQPGLAQLWQLKGLLHRALEDMAGAATAFEAAVRLAPRDAKIAYGHAQSALDAGYPAIALFERTLALSGDRLSVMQGLTAARLAERGAAVAIGGLVAEVARQPLWLQGHWLLARLRWAAGEREHFARSIERVLEARPADVSLWAHLVFVQMHARRYVQALDTIARATAAVGPHPAFAINAAACLSESGEIAQADRLFAAQAAPDDTAIAIQHVRHALRTGRIAAAARLAEQFQARPDGHVMTPYLATAWRMLGDPRWAWLEGGPGLVGVHDLGLDAALLAALRDRLRILHGGASDPMEQSLRGGTQTDGMLLSRAEPEFRALRAACVQAVARHVAQLPPADPRHPTLAPPRDRRIRFSGSWSVRLSQGGFHAEHVHPAGWLSSALYLALPDVAPGDAPHAGWLTLGAPPAELGLDLAPAQMIEPKIGRLALFPSTMWHGTLPFAAGERLTVAFDVAPPY